MEGLFSSLVFQFEDQFHQSYFDNIGWIKLNELIRSLEYN